MRSIRTNWPKEMEGKVMEKKKPVVNAFGHRTSSKTGQIDSLLTKRIFGSNMKEICEKLHVTEDYVKSHLQTLKKKGVPVRRTVDGRLFVDF